MPATEPIKVTGLREFRKALKDMEAGQTKQLRIVFNDAMALVVNWVKPRIPHQSGRAASSVKARSSQTAARIAIGGTRAPYFPWLDFGGRTGPGGSVVRPFYTKGRYLYPGLEATRDDVTDVMEQGLVELGRAAGLEVSST